MIFHRKKSTAESAPGTNLPRGRDRLDKTAESGSAVSTRYPDESSHNPLARRFQADAEPDTVDLENRADEQDSEQEEQGSSTTRILNAEPAEAPAAEEVEAVANPVVGFLAIVSGAGRGNICPVYSGVNSIGRSASNRVALDFGDEQISQDNHCQLSYDPLTRKFFLQPGNTNELIYLDDQPVLAETELVAGKHFHLGETELRFTALCGQDFDWGNYSRK